jgi:suppressor for copper-sensitivity B
LHKDDVQAALQQPDVVALRGDWTLPSEALPNF